eukprot:CAMPEP_0176500202 /NCGR_PEP_ID=MMETSP0200_2-20121128/13388_1 /TAXON_ID=947934 /ORGANISM="Chaetoceros sp., Strain GSL56" /LENGTH=477 /DNA_ID=CAMNT_0017898779 /DNA_START=324 /DNA_END=1753 /DNA_ORIENTATION=+
MRIILTPAIAAVVFGNPVQSAFSVYSNNNRNIQPTARGIYLNANGNVPPYYQDKSYRNIPHHRDESKSHMFSSSQSSFFVRNQLEQTNDQLSSAAFHSFPSYAFSPIELARLEASVEKYVQQRVEGGVTTSIEKKIEGSLGLAAGSLPDNLEKKINGGLPHTLQKKVDYASLEKLVEFRVEKPSELRVEGTTEHVSETTVEAYPQINVGRIERLAEKEVELQTELDVIAISEAQVEASVENNLAYVVDVSRNVSDEQRHSKTTVQNIMTFEKPITTSKNLHDLERRAEVRVAQKVESQKERQAAKSVETTIEKSVEKQIQKTIQSIDFHCIETKEEKAIEHAFESWDKRNKEKEAEAKAETYVEQYNYYFPNVQNSDDKIATGNEKFDAIQLKSNASISHHNPPSSHSPDWRQLEASCERSVESAAEVGVGTKSELMVEESKEAAVIASSELNVERDFPVPRSVTGQVPSLSAINMS